MAAEALSPTAAAPTLARPQIRVEGVVKSFSGHVVVDVDELVLGDQAIEGLIGPNGAGKTTLMRMIMHSIPLDRGRISLEQPDGHDVVLSRMPPHLMARHGVVKSNQVITDFDHLTIWDSLLLAATEHRFEQPHEVFSEEDAFERHQEEIRRLLDFFELRDPTTFAMSAGDKKLIDIVRCLLLKPSFLLLDEPTAGLPDELTEKVMTVIKELSEQGTSVVIVEHDLDVIWNLCVEVSFMAEGRVILKGDPASIRENRTVVEKYLGEGHV